MDSYDFVIVGAGCAGLAAAMYGARLGLKTLCLGKSHGSEFSIGGVITTTESVENYPGFIKLTGEELAGNLKKHAESYSLVKIKEEKVLDIIKKNEIFLIKTNENRYKSKSILFATGTRWKKLEVSGSKKFENKGVAYCALCDGPLYKNKIVAVIGGSDSAAKEALLLSEHAKKVYIIYRGEKIRAEPINTDKIKANKKIEIINNTNVIKIIGKDRLEKIGLDKKYNGKKELYLDGMFVAIGHEVLSQLASKMGINCNKRGEIIINHKTSETNILGVFAAGDVTDRQFKQAITGVSEGCTAAYGAYEYIHK